MKQSYRLKLSLKKKKRILNLVTSKINYAPTKMLSKTLQMDLHVTHLQKHFFRTSLSTIKHSWRVSYARIIIRLYLHQTAVIVMKQPRGAYGSVGIAALYCADDICQAGVTVQQTRDFTVSLKGYNKFVRKQVR